MANFGNSGPLLEMRQAEAAARTLGIKVTELDIRRADDIAAAFASIKGQAEALYVASDALLNTNRESINRSALDARLPTMHGFREIVAAGGLMSYAPNYVELFRRTADYVDKILRGTRPDEIPVEQPTKFELIINLTTAKALGLDVPLFLQQRADEVIE
jgi:putative ABC transport system substrate-binding protein